MAPKKPQQRIELEWDEENIGHIAEHEVEPSEVEDVVQQRCYPTRAVNKSVRNGEERILLLGRTCADRHIFVVVTSVEKPAPSAR